METADVFIDALKYSRSLTTHAIGLNISKDKNWRLSVKHMKDSGISLAMMGRNNK
jgi:hypothetical protein